MVRPLLLMGVTLLSSMIENLAKELPTGVKQGGTRVSVMVSVTDGQGRPVSSLSKDDFRLYRGQSREEIVGFVSPLDPGSVVILLDSSISMQSLYPEMREGVIHFGRQLKEEIAIGFHGWLVKVERKERIKMD